MGAPSSKYYYIFRIYFTLSISTLAYLLFMALLQACDIKGGMISEIKGCCQGYGFEAIILTKSSVNVLLSDGAIDLLKQYHRQALRGIDYHAACTMLFSLVSISESVEKSDEKTSEEACPHGIRR